MVNHISSVLSISNINAGLLNKRYFAPGDYIIREGELGESAYLIQNGMVEVLVDGNEKHIKICEYGPGELVGEMAMIDDLPRTASIKAITDCEVIEISRQDFSQRLKLADPILNNVMKIILKRYRALLKNQLETSSPKRNKIECSTQDDRNQFNNTDLINTFTESYEIQEAIKNNELTFYYQPIVCSQTKKVAGFEALVRWQHPDKGLIFPDKFIPLCEKNGLIADITLKAIEQVSLDYKRLKTALKSNNINNDFFISINISVADIQNTELLKKLENSCFNCNSEAKLHIEIVESIFIEKPEVARNFIDKCRAMGISISLDDFGTGYSSLSYLQDFDFNTLKIDRKFVSTMLTNKKSMLLIKMIAGLAQNLNLDIVAEGVEDEQELEVLKTMGIEFIQGYYFSKPVPFKQAQDYLINGFN